MVSGRVKPCLESPIGAMPLLALAAGTVSVSGFVASTKTITKTTKTTAG